MVETEGKKQKKMLDEIMGKMASHSKNSRSYREPPSLTAPKSVAHMTTESIERHGWIKVKENEPYHRK